MLAVTDRVAPQYVLGFPYWSAKVFGIIIVESGLRGRDAARREVD